MQHRRRLGAIAWVAIALTIAGVFLPVLWIPVLCLPCCCVSRRNPDRRVVVWAAVAAAAGLFIYLALFAVSEVQCSSMFADADYSICISVLLITGKCVHGKGSMLT